MEASYSPDGRLFSRDVQKLGSVVVSGGYDLGVVRCTLILEGYGSGALLASGVSLCVKYDCVLIWNTELETR